MTNARELANLVGGTLTNVTSGTNNVALGDEALEAVTSGSENVAIGKDAGTAITTGTDNTFVGMEAGKNTTDRNHNTGLGNEALKTNVNGAKNVAVGSGALLTMNPASDSDTYNVGVGYDAGGSITTGVDNTLIGGLVGDALTSGKQNVAIGGGTDYAALGSDTQGKFTVAVGFGALRAQNFTSDTASNNVAVGYFAGGVMTTGTGNTFVGSLAGDDCVDGTNNTAVGKSSLSADAGDNNTAVGLEALRDTTGSVNTAIGKNSGNAITSGSKNTILGAYNGNQDSVDIRTSDNNIVLSDGDGNVQYWHRGADNTTVLAGAHAGAAWTTDSGFRIHGNGVTAQWVSLTNESVTATDETMIIHRKAAVTNGEALQFYRAGSAVGTITVSSGSTAFNTSSDYRLKENVSDITGATERLKQLKPKKFSWIEDEIDTADNEGFIAHEIQEVVPKVVVGAKDGTREGKDGTTIPHYQQIDLSKLVPLLTAALQEAIAKIETLETEVAALKG